MKKPDKTYINLAVITGGELGLKLVSYVIFVLLARFILPKDDMGLLFGGIAIGTLAAALCEAGTTRCLLRTASGKPERTQDFLADVIILRAILSLVVCVTISVTYAALVPGEALVIILAVGYCMIESYFYAFSAALLANKMVFTRVACLAIGPVLMLLGVVGSLVFGGGLYTVLAVFVVANLLMVLASAWIVHTRLVRVSLRSSPRRLRALLKEALPIAILLFVSIAYFKADTVMLLAMRSKESVANYEAAYKLFEVSRVIIRSSMNVVAPIVAAMVVAARWAALRNLVLKVFGGAVGIGLLMSAAVLPISVWLVVMIFGPDYRDSGAVVFVLFLATAPLFLGFCATITLSMMHMDRIAVWISVTCLVANVLANVVVIPAHGEVGAAWTTLASELLLAALTTGVVGWTIHRRIRAGKQPDAAQVPTPPTATSPAT